MIEIVFTLLLNALPLLIFMIPLLFLRKKVVGKLYSRIVIGVIIFYLIYWILPVIFQIGVAPNQLVVSGTDMSLGLAYIACHFLSLIFQFILYPLVSLPFIFCVAPFISILVVRRRIKKEGGSELENLKNITYEFNESPLQKIRENLKIGDWKKEKEILKLMIVLLPISLYLLQVILDISNLQTVSLTEGTTGLGWFIEIIFVYLAIFIFSIELLVSSQIALKGRYFGEKIREQLFKSLYQIGSVMSALSLLLFIVQYQASIGIIIYFFAYFIMASVIFVLFIDIFEPISILIFLKIINWWKERKQNKRKMDTTNLLYTVIAGGIGLIIFLIIYFAVPYFLIKPFLGDPDPTIQASGLYITQNPSLLNSLGYDLVLISGIGMTLIFIIVLMIFFSQGLKYVKSPSIGFIIYIPIIIFIFLWLFNISKEYWVTGQTSYTNVFGFPFFTLRTASFEASFSITGGISLLGILAYPYLYLRYIFCIMFLTLFLFYTGAKFKIKTIPIEEKIVQRTIFSGVTQYFTPNEYKVGKTRYLITKNVGVEAKGAEQEREEVKDLLKLLETDQMLESMKPKKEQEEEFRKFYYTLKYLFTNKQISIWKPEFGYSFEKVEKHALYIMYTDGRDVFNYPWVKQQLQDPALISGMFSAITSFIQETTHATQTLNTIDHGDITIMIEYGKRIFGALFIKGKQSSEIRAQLKEFIAKFEKKHADILHDWTGTLSPFREDHLLVVEVFKEE